MQHDYHAEAMEAVRRDYHAAGDSLDQLLKQGGLSIEAQSLLLLDQTLDDATRRILFETLVVPVQDDDDTVVVVTARASESAPATRASEAPGGWLTQSLSYEASLKKRSLSEYWAQRVGDLHSEKVGVGDGGMLAQASRIVRATKDWLASLMPGAKRQKTDAAAAADDDATVDFSQLNELPYEILQRIHQFAKPSNDATPSFPVDQSRFPQLNRSFAAVAELNIPTHSYNVGPKNALRVTDMHMVVTRFMEIVVRMATANFYRNKRRDWIIGDQPHLSVQIPNGTRMGAAQDTRHVLVTPRLHAHMLAMKAGLMFSLTPLSKSSHTTTLAPLFELDLTVGKTEFMLRADTWARRPWNIEVETHPGFTCERYHIATTYYRHHPLNDRFEIALDKMLLYSRAPSNDAPNEFLPTGNDAEFNKYIGGQGGDTFALWSGLDFDTETFVGPNEEYEQATPYGRLRRVLLDNGWQYQVACYAQPVYHPREAGNDQFRPAEAIEELYETPMNRRDEEIELTVLENMPAFTTYARAALIWPEDNGVGLKSMPDARASSAAFAVLLDNILPLSRETLAAAKNTTGRTWLDDVHFQFNELSIDQLLPTSSSGRDVVVAPHLIGYFQFDVSQIDPIPADRGGDPETTSYADVVRALRINGQPAAFDLSKRIDQSFYRALRAIKRAMYHFFNDGDATERDLRDIFSHCLDVYVAFEQYTPGESVLNGAAAANQSSATHSYASHFRHFDTFVSMIPALETPDSEDAIVMNNGESPYMPHVGMYVSGAVDIDRGGAANEAQIIALPNVHQVYVFFNYNKFSAMLHHRRHDYLRFNDAFKAIANVQLARYDP